MLVLVLVRRLYTYTSTERAAARARPDRPGLAIRVLLQRLPATLTRYLGR